MAQMKYRIEEGNGECIYSGIFDNGDLKGLNQQDLDESLNNLKLISII